MKHILMLNTLPIINFDSKNKKQKTAGNQTLYNTLKGYSENGFSVTMLTFFDVPKISTPFPNIVIRRSYFFHFFNLLMNIKNKTSKTFQKRKYQSDNKVTTEINRTGSIKYFKYWEIFGYLEGLLISRKNKPDLIYGYEIYSTKPAKHLSEKLGVPCVSRFQGTELGFFIDSDKFDKAICYVKGTKVDTDLVIMANDGTDGDKVLRKLNIDENKVRFWVNGLHDKEKYLNYKRDIDYKQKMNLPEDAFVICTANRFVDWKRIDRVINMMSELSIINKKAYLIAIGDGPEKEALIALANSLDLNNIIFTGAMNHEDAIYHIANADLYITLNHSGNLGNSILEALALGTAICTLKNDSVEKVLTDDYNALLFEKLDERYIASELSKNINDPNKLRQLRINARRYAENNLLSWPERMILESTEVNNLIDNHVGNSRQ